MNCDSMIVLLVDGGLSAETEADGAFGVGGVDGVVVLGDEDFAGGYEAAGAARAGSRRDSQACLVSVPPTRFAASEGQMVLSGPRSARSSRMADSRAHSALAGAGPRQASEQYLMMSQSRACCRVQWMGRRQVLQSLSLWGVMRSGLGLRSGIE
jgi:hypothetical protein